MEQRDDARKAPPQTRDETTSDMLGVRRCTLSLAFMTAFAATSLYSTVQDHPVEPEASASTFGLSVQHAADQIYCKFLQTLFKGNESSKS